MWSELSGSQPLIHPGVRSAPHGNLTIREALLSSPFNGVIAVIRIVSERVEASLGVPSAATVNQQKSIAALSEIARDLVVRVRDIRRHHDNGWFFQRCSIFFVDRKICGGVKFGAIAGWNLDAPADLIASRWII